MVAPICLLAQDNGTSSTNLHKEDLHCLQPLANLFLDGKISIYMNMAKGSDAKKINLKGLNEMYKALQGCATYLHILGTKSYPRGDCTSPSSWLTRQAKQWSPRYEFSKALLHDVQPKSTADLKAISRGLLRKEQWLHRLLYQGFDMEKEDLTISIKREHEKGLNEDIRSFERKHVKLVGGAGSSLSQN